MVAIRERKQRPQSPIFFEIYFMLAGEVYPYYIYIYVISYLSNGAVASSGYQLLEWDPTRTIQLVGTIDRLDLTTR